MKLQDRLASPNIEKRKIADLKPHPENEKIYGKNEDILKLIEDITNSKMVTPLIITPNNTIIAGHRRHKACQVLGIDTISVIVMSYLSYDDEVKALIVDNAQRKKTIAQIRREAETLDTIKMKEADERKKEGKNQYTASVSTEPKANEESGNSAKVIAETIGTSEGTVKRIRRTNKKAKELTDAGQSDKAEILIGQLDNISVRAGEDATKIIDEIEILEDGKVKSYNPEHINGTVNIDDLKDGRIDLREILPKHKNQQNNGNESDSDKPTITKEDISNAVNQYNARSRGEIGMEVVSYDSGVIIGGIKEMIAEFKRALTRIMAYESEINKLTTDEIKTIEKMFNQFEETYLKDKNNLLKGAN